MLTPLLATKLYIPPARANRVLRPRLIEQLKILRRLTFIAAPAGFGKTTLLSEWIPQSEHCVTWLSLDEEDNDPIRFLVYLVAALQKLRPDLGASTLVLLQLPEPPPITSILSTLINEISSFPENFSTVLEDYHLIKAQSIHEALTFLLDHLPPQMHIILTTRADPPLPIARLRVRHQLIELRAADLRFSPDEAAFFLNEVMGLRLSVDDIAALEARTEGWVAGLQLAALSMQGRDDISGFIQAFSGSHRHVLTYLAEEVLERCSAGTLNFLLQTSILDRLSGPLCDAVTGAKDSQKVLQKLEQDNLFIEPLDNEGKWFRYHHLFAEVLLARLQQSQPELLSSLHRRAGLWYASQGLIEEAVRHALAGADYEEAARLIEGLAGTMLRRGSSASLTKWLDAIPEETVCAHPRLCLARGWTFQLGRAVNLERAEEWAQRALQAAQVDGSLDSGVIGEATALQAMIAATRGDMARSRELSQQALNCLPADSPWRSAMAFCLGTAYMISGDLVTAARALGEALLLSQADGARFLQLAAASFLADIQVFLGHLGRALELYQQVLAWADHGIPQKGGVMAHAGLAYILYERDQLEAALAHIQLGIEQLDHVGGAWATHVIYRVWARVQQARGNSTDALDTLDRSYQLGKNVRVSLVVTQAAALRACLLLARGDLGAAKMWAADSGLSPEDEESSRPGLRELEYIALARVLNAQERQAESLSLLDRLLQSAESEERSGSAIAILALQALVVQTQGNTTRALASLERALALGEPEGYLRIFLDEGEPMRQLISAFRKKFVSHPLGVYAEKLLSAFDPPPTPAASASSQPSGNQALVEPLSARELDVLRLIIEGHSNQAIAGKLFLSKGTVKVHIKHIYAKLEVNSRTQAVVRVNELDLH